MSRSRRLRADIGGDGGAFIGTYETQLFPNVLNHRKQPPGNVENYFSICPTQHTDGVLIIVLFIATMLRIGWLGFNVRSSPPHAALGADTAEKFISSSTAAMAQHLRKQLLIDKTS